MHRRAWDRTRKATFSRSRTWQCRRKDHERDKTCTRSRPNYESWENCVVRKRDHASWSVNRVIDFRSCAGFSDAYHRRASRSSSCRRPRKLHTIGHQRSARMQLSLSLASTRSTGPKLAFSRAAITTRNVPSVRGAYWLRASQRSCAFTIFVRGSRCQSTSPSLLLFK